MHWASDRNKPWTGCQFITGHTRLFTHTLAVKTYMGN
uniref:Uncharacterized protein n=1 Tax=Anguilla anguilla TaxID=7936 RepID=A0A0E9VF06_ANGAN